MSKTGQLLVAAPTLPDPNFKQTVVLLLDHSSDGSFGVVLNRPLEIEVAAVLPGWEDVVSSPARVFGGGPVGLDGALGLVASADVGDSIGGSFALVDLDVEPYVAGASDLRIFAGHSGWSGGQIEAELEAGDWFVVEAHPGDPFTDHPERLWRDVLRRQGGELALLSTWPADPSLN